MSRPKVQGLSWSPSNSKAGGVAFYLVFRLPRANKETLPPEVDREVEFLVTGPALTSLRRTRHRGLEL